MTLNDYFALNSIFARVCLASDRATFENNNCVKTDKDRHILSAAQIFGRDSIGLGLYKVYADIPAGSLEKRHNDNGVARRPTCCCGVHLGIAEVYLLCVINRSISLDVGVGRWCRSLRR